MGIEDPPFEAFGDNDLFDDELDEILGKISEILDSEDDQQHELIRLCDIALERVARSQPENTELQDSLNWSAGYAYLELAGEDLPIEKGLSYINLIRNRFPQWYLAYAQIHFFHESFAQTLEHLDLLENTIKKDYKNNDIDIESVQRLRQLAAIGRMRTYLAMGEMKKYDSCFSKYLFLISKHGIQSGLNHFGVCQDLIMFDSNVRHLTSLLPMDDEFGTPFGMKEALLSQSSFLKGDMNRSNRYAYIALKRVTGAYEEIWDIFINGENDPTTPHFTIGAFECPSLDSPPGPYCLMDLRAAKYISDNNILQDVYYDEDIGVNFPTKIASFDYQFQQFYDAPGAGYSLRYGDTNLVKIDIYVYDYEHTDIEDGISSERIITEFDDFYSGISYMESQGSYKNAMKLNSGEKNFSSDNIRFLWAQAQYEVVPGDEVQFFGDIITSVYLTGYKGKFVKVRLTVKKEAHDEKEKDITAFMDDFSVLLSNPR